MKISTIFLIILIVLAITYSALVAFGKSGLKVQKVFADISSSLTFQNSLIRENTVQPQTPNKTTPAPAKKTEKKETPVIITDENKIKIAVYGISLESYYHPSSITLSYKSGSGKTDITGWKIKTRKGEFTIPQAEEKYNVYMSESDLNISKYDTLYLVSGKSPLGKNFKSNQCLGYLGQSNFYPSFWASCPSKTKAEGFSSLSPACQDFISYSYGCQTPNYSQNLTIATDSACVAFINKHYCYSGCFTDNSSNKDFLGSSWYVYTGTNLVDPLHDTIYLYDQANNLVSQYTY